MAGAHKNIGGISFGPTKCVLYHPLAHSSRPAPMFTAFGRNVPLILDKEAAFAAIETRFRRHLALGAGHRLSFDTKGRKLYN